MPMNDVFRLLFHATFCVPLFHIVSYSRTATSMIHLMTHVIAGSRLSEPKKEKETRAQGLKYAGSRRISDPGPKRNVKKGSGAPYHAEDSPDLSKLRDPGPGPGGPRCGGGGGPVWVWIMAIL